MTSSKSSLNVLISGGAKGIGRGLTRLLLKQGHHVAVLDSNDAELCNTASQLGTAYPKSFHSSLCDLRVPSEIERSISESREFLNGRCDLLINNAAYTGGIPGTPLPKLPLEEWQRSIETNLTAPMLVTQACLPMLKRCDENEQGGSVVMVSSTRAHQSEPNSEAYASTKAGLIGLMHSMAVSLAPYGIRVNAVVLGWIHVANENELSDSKGTPWSEGLSEEDHSWHLAGRVGKVDDVFRAVDYLAKAPFISGTEMFVDGGVPRKMVYPE